MIDRYFRLLLLIALYLLSSKAQSQTLLDSVHLASQVASYESIANQLIQTATLDSSKSSFAFARLASLCDTYGARLSGTENLERAIDWIVGEMKKDGFDDVHTEPVKVPRWVRGKESCELISPRAKKLAMLGLGGSIATAKGGIEAEVLVVKSFEDLERRKSEAQGKIVLFNIPFTEYGRTVITRTNGSVRAAKAGAVASLIRSIAPYSIYSPHTGNMAYVDSVQKIPTAAITLEDAEMLTRMQERGEKIRIRMNMEASMQDSTWSRNVICEIKGNEKASEIVVMGGHIDSWDVGQGAMDDGGGCIATWQALRLIKKLGIKPKRTLRVVLWTNEENGLRGANNYAETHAKEKHVLALESDGGVFKPQGFSMTANDTVFSKAKAVSKLLEVIGSGKIQQGAGGADIGPLMKSGVPVMGLQVEGSKYFWFHHTEADTIDKLNPHELNLCTATMAIMSLVLGDVL